MSYLRVLPIVCGLIMVFGNASGTGIRLSSIPESEKSVLRTLPHWRFTTEAYRKEAVRLMLKEANRVAAKLPLNERLPLKESDLVGRHVSPPGLMIGLGWVASSNFNYIFDRKCCAIVGRDASVRYDEQKAKYRWPVDRMDKKKALQIACEIMSAMDIDVAGLNRDFSVEITTPDAEGFIRKRFFPHYTVIWRKGDDLIAFIEFVEPTRYIFHLRVEDRRYILGEPILIPNLAELLGQTNASAKVIGVLPDTRPNRLSAPAGTPPTQRTN